MPASAFFADAVAEAGRDLAVARATDGDSALLIDPDPRQAVKGGLEPAAEAAALGLCLDIRFGGDAGFVELMGGDEGAQARAGLALLVAARLEPHAPAGTILVTGQFDEAWRNLLGAGRLRARPVEPGRVPLLRESDGRFGLAKPGGEAPMLRRLVLLDGPEARSAERRPGGTGAAPRGSLLLRTCSSARSPAGRDTCRS